MSYVNWSVRLFIYAQTLFHILFCYNVMYIFHVPVFEKADVDFSKPIVSTCYIGMSACVLPLAAEKAGHNIDNINIYEASLLSTSYFSLFTFIVCNKQLDCFNTGIVD